MKYWLSLFCISFTLLQAQEQSTSSTEEHSPSLWDYYPIHTGGNAIYIGKSKVEPRKGHEKGYLQFNKENTFLTMLVPLSETTYIFPRLELNSFCMNWNQNPKFNQSRYYYAQFGLMLYTKALEKWRWIFRYDLNLDTQHFTQVGLYGLSTGLVWGSYQIHPKWNYHVGGTGYVGLQGSTFYPLIGADYSPNKKWNFLAIFPINYMIQYKPVSWFKIALKGRPLRERFRTGSYEAQPKSVFNYSTMGGELNIVFEKPQRVECELYIGYNFGGTFYIKSYNHEEPYYTDIQGAPYAGINFDYAF